MAKSKSVKVLGHRGSQKFPENTLPAFEEALKTADGFEFDVQMTQDGIPVVIHDDTVDRTTNGEGRVDSYSLRELQKLKILNHDGEPLSDVIVPTLEEVMNLAGSYIKKRSEIVINVEIKDVRSTPKVAELIKKLVQEKNWQYSNVIVSSFEHEALKEMKLLNPAIPLGVLYESAQEAILGELITTLDATTIHPSIADLKSEVFNPASCGKPIVLWIDGEATYPDNMPRIKEALKVNPSIVISNHPGEVKRELQKIGRTISNFSGMMV